MRHAHCSQSPYLSIRVSSCCCQPSPTHFEINTEPASNIPLLKSLFIAFIKVVHKRRLSSFQEKKRGKRSAHKCFVVSCRSLPRAVYVSHKVSGRTHYSIPRAAEGSSCLSYYTMRSFVRKQKERILPLWIMVECENSSCHVYGSRMNTSLSVASLNQSYTEDKELVQFSISFET